MLRLRYWHGLRWSTEKTYSPDKGKYVRITCGCCEHSSTKSAYESISSGASLSPGQFAFRKLLEERLMGFARNSSRKKVGSWSWSWCYLLIREALFLKGSRWDNEPRAQTYGLLDADFKNYCRRIIASTYTVPPKSYNWLMFPCLHEYPVRGYGPDYMDSCALRDFLHILDFSSAIASLDALLTVFDACKT